MSRRYLTTFAALGLAVSAHAASAASLTVAVTPIDETGGAIMLAMFDAAAAWDGAGPPAKAARIDVDGDSVAVTFDALSPGRYAIKLYHDVDGDGELDTNTIGLPVEPYGFSGDGGRFGPPSFDEAAFEVADGEHHELTIRLR